MRYVKLLFLIGLLACGLSSVLAQDSSQSTLVHDDLERSYYLHVPESYDGSAAVPLLVALHPAGSSGKAMAAITGLDAAADERGFITVYPDSERMLWNDGRIDVGISTASEGADDIGYIEALIAHLSETYAIDQEQIWLTGFSYGGVMAYRLACEMPERFSKVAVVGALLWEYHTDVCPEATDSATDMLIILGKDDPIYFSETSTYPLNSADPDRPNSYTIFGANDTMIYWAEYFACDFSQENIAREGERVTVKDCQDDVTINFFGVDMGGQSWPRAGDYRINRFGLDATLMVTDFFEGQDDWVQEQGATPEDQTRSWVLYVPPGYDPDEPTALVMALHGRPSNGIGTAFITDMNPVAAENNFIVVYPNGQFIRRPDDMPVFGWNYVRDVAVFPQELPQDDTQYLIDLIHDLGLDLNIDERRVYVTGFSNGGFMTQRLACEASEHFAAFAPVGATAFAGIDNICESSPPVPILMIHGTRDVSVPWQGIAAPVIVNETQRQIYTTWPIEQTIQLWTAVNRCEADLDMEIMPQGGDSPETQVRLITVNDCEEPGEVIFYGIDGGGHNWPGVPGVISEQIAGNVNMDIHGSEVIWEFFSQHSLDDAAD